MMASRVHTECEVSEVVLVKVQDALNLITIDDAKKQPVKPNSINHHGANGHVQPRSTFRDIAYSFASASEFEAVHLPGATIELENDLAAVRRFNDSRKQWKGWVISPTSKATSMRGYMRQYILLVDFADNQSSLFPKLGDPFHVHLVQSFTLKGEAINPGFLSAERIENPFDGICSPNIAKLPAIRISMPAFMDGKEEVNLLAPFQHAQTIDTINHLALDDEKSVRIVIRLEEILTTFLAETGALAWLSQPKRAERQDGPSEKSLAAFAHMLDFSQPPQMTVNLFSVLPHMASPATDLRIPAPLRERYSNLNRDHQMAYGGMAKIPAGLHIVSGCPGAGKTHWNVTVSALAMSNTSRLGKPIKVLYVIDVNKPVDDVADRMTRLCREVGMKKLVIRMRGWPREIKFSSTLNSTPEDIEKLMQRGMQTGDFTPQFLVQAQLAASSGKSIGTRDPDKALSLDQAAWNMFELCKGRKYTTLSVLLKRLLERGIENPNQMRSLRSQIYQLYRDVVQQADFIATTPVATWGEFSNIFQPDLIIMDEAPHARELTSLIPIAFFNPLAWILSGDYRQTRPFVSGSSGLSSKSEPGQKPNPFAQQMTISTMERAEAVGAVQNSLMINHRAYGKLEELGSNVFYDGKMVSALPEAGKWPDSVRHLQSWLANMFFRGSDREPRALVQLRGSGEIRQASSFLNPAHQRWVMAQVTALLKDPGFHQVNKPNCPGKIMIIAPYRAAVMGYLGEVRRLPNGLSSRIDVRTVDTAQGHEADVVFLDLVRTTTVGFMDDPHRLNVAITRARQAEIIVMDQGMLRRRNGRGGFIPTVHLHKIWRHCLDRQLLQVC